MTGALAGPRPPVTITVYGVPAPQGSKSGFAVKKGGSFTGAVAMKESSAKKLKPWRQAVLAAGLAAMTDPWLDGECRTPLDGPLEARVVFTFGRPRSHYRTGRNAHLIRDSAPARPAVYPDASKALRAVEDSLVDAGVIRDDCRIVEYSRLAKVYAGEDPEALHVPGAVITVRQLP